MCLSTKKEIVLQVYEEKKIIHSLYAYMCLVSVHIYTKDCLTRHAHLSIYSLDSQMNEYSYTDMHSIIRSFIYKTYIHIRLLTPITRQRAIQVDSQCSITRQCDEVQMDSSHFKLLLKSLLDFILG